jgi:hypothetical protein
MWFVVERSYGPKRSGWRMPFGIGRKPTGMIPPPFVRLPGDVVCGHEVGGDGQNRPSIRGRQVLVEGGGWVAGEEVGGQKGEQGRVGSEWLKRAARKTGSDGPW